jgi:hypothetical protein
MASDPASNHSGEPPSFFSLPRELRDDIYDILHQHEEELHRGQLTFTFPLTHLRHISRRFTTESDLRAPPTSRLVISQRRKNWLDVDAMNTMRLRRSLLGRGKHCNALEFNASVCGDGQGGHHLTLLRCALYDTYPLLMEGFILSDANLFSVFRPGGVHLRLFFKPMSYVDTMKRTISARIRRGDYAHCDKISLVLYSKGDDIPNNDSLSRGQIVAVWNKGLGWSDYGVTSEQARTGVLGAEEESSQ